MPKPSSPAIQEARLSLWRERLTRFSTAAQSVAEFCQSESISQASFYGWRAKLLHHDPRLPLPVARKKSAPSTFRSSFIDIGAVTTTSVPHAPDMRTAVEIRLDLGNGILLTIVR